MDVAKVLTWKVKFALAGVLTVGAAAPAHAGVWIIRLKKENPDALQVQSVHSRFQDFKQTRLSRKKGLLLPRTELLITEDLSPGEVAALRADSAVAYVEKDIRWQTQDNVGESTSWPSSFTQAPWLKDLMGFSADNPDPEISPDLGKTRTVVAVIDTGSRSDHPFLSSALEPNSSELNGNPSRDDDGNGFVDDFYGANAITRQGSGTESSSSHGTHVAGIIKTIRDHAIEEFPAASQVSLLPIRFIGDDGSGSTASAVIALEYALARGARVINASWGAKGNGAYSQALYDSFAKLYAADVFFAVAAGNADGQGQNNNDVTPYFPANYNIPSLVSVASVTPSYSSALNRLVSLDLSPFSNYGRNTVQIAAPGDYADGRGGNSGILSAYSGFGPWGNLYIKKQGTSMAAPVIAGIAAVMRAVNPSLTAYETKDLLIKSARTYNQLASLQSSAMANAYAAISLAEITPSQGLSPRLPAAPVRQNQATSPPERSAGCGTVAPINPEGPFGGNSLGLVTAAYALWALFRKRRKKTRV
jgi:subtilisin family serine protease